MSTVLTFIKNKNLLTCHHASANVETIRTLSNNVNNLYLLLGTSNQHLRFRIQLAHLHKATMWKQRHDHVPDWLSSLYNLWQMVCAVCFWPRQLPCAWWKRKQKIVHSSQGFISQDDVKWSPLQQKMLVPCWFDSLWVRLLWEVKKLMGQEVWTT